MAGGPVSPVPYVGRPSPGAAAAMRQAAALSAATQQGAAAAAAPVPGQSNEHPGEVWIAGDRTANDHEHSNRVEAATGNPLYSNETWMTPDQAKAHFSQMSPDEYAALRRSYIHANGKPPSSASSLLSFWEASVDQSVAIRENTGMKVSPYQVWDRVSQGALGGDGPGGGGSGPSTSTSTSTSRQHSVSTSRSNDTSTQVDLTNRSDAKALIGDAFEAALGRKATKKEIDAFHAHLNKREEANPELSSSQTTSRSETDQTSKTKQSDSSVSTPNGKNGSDTVSSSTSDTNSTSDTDSTSDTNSVTSGGLNRQQAAEDWTQRNNEMEYEAYQKSTKYLAAFNRAIMSPF